MELEILEILRGQCSVSLENAITFERLKNQQSRLQNLNKETQGEPGTNWKPSLME